MARSTKPEPVAEPVKPTRKRAGGHSGGPPIRIVGAARYREMSAQLHRHRRGLYEDSALSHKERTALVAKLDALIDALQPYSCPPVTDSRQLTLTE